MYKYIIINGNQNYSKQCTQTNIVIIKDINRVWASSSSIRWKNWGIKESNNYNRNNKPTEKNYIKRKQPNTPIVEWKQSDRNVWPNQTNYSFNCKTLTKSLVEYGLFIMWEIKFQMCHFLIITPHNSNWNYSIGTIMRHQDECSNR